VEIGAREQEGPAETMGADEEVVEIDGEESAGTASTMVLKRLLDEKDQTIAEQTEEIADLQEYIRQLQDTAAASMRA
jgi:hypothetical protein